MAAGVAHVCDADCSVAISGIAGPGGGTAEKPVGLVYIGMFFLGTSAAFRHVFPGDRASIRQATTHAALQHLIEALGSHPM
jgi:PncC family amidohydrolase